LSSDFWDFYRILCSVLLEKPLVQAPLKDNDTGMSMSGVFEKKIQAALEPYVKEQEKRAV
jgi:hypothetical protein